MTLEEFQDDVWRRLGPRKHMAGRGTVRDLVQLTIEQWDGEMLGYCESERERSVVAANIVANVRRMYHAVSGYSDAEFGFLWAIILSAVVSAIVQLIIKWWFERASNRVLLMGWQRELTR